MQNQTLSLLNDYMPEVSQYKSRFESLNTLLNKTTLTGKISSLDIAENLFAYMEETQQKFSQLQERLIDTLIEQNFLTILSEAELNAQSNIDVLNRNLFERTADIAFLAKSEMMNNFITHQSDALTKEAIETRMHEYTRKYSVYEDMILFDREGRILARLNSSNPATQTSEPMIAQALSLQGKYLEVFSTADFINKPTPSLLYLAPVQRIGENERVGVIALVFKFEDEMERIFKRFSDSTPGSLIMLLDAKNRLIASGNPKEFPLGSTLSIQKIGDHHFAQTNKRTYLVAKAQTQGYFGYTGPHWSTALLLPLRSAFDSKRLELGKIPPELLEESSLMTNELRRVIAEAENINEDLGDVVINGEIIASKSHSYALNPILNNIRLLSEEINHVCVDSIRGLQKSILTSALKGVSFYARVAIDLMDRNLYERANNCRWWALTHRFITNMHKSQENSVREILMGILHKINALYPMYHNLFLFDAMGKIVALSNKEEMKFIDEPISSEDFSRVRSIRDTQKYYVSAFEPTPFYRHKPTYIFYAPILSPDENKSFLGGIGIVFDAESQLSTMLHEALPKRSEVLSSQGELFGLLVERNGKIIASTNEKLKVGEILEIDSRFLEIRGNEAIDEVITFQEKRYMLGVQASVGYREFKVSDGYNCPVLCLMFIEV